MTDKIKKLYKFSNSAENITYYVLSNCSVNNYVSTAMSRYNKNNQWSPVIDIIKDDDYKVQHLFIGETDIEYIKNGARFLCENDIYCVNQNKPLSNEKRLLLENERSHRRYDRIREARLQQIQNNENLLTSGLSASI